MLTECPDDKAALFTSSSILQKPIDDSLFRLAAPLALTVGNFDERLKHSFDSQWLWFPEREALFLFGFKGNVSSVAMFIIQSLQSSIV